MRRARRQRRHEGPDKSEQTTDAGGAGSRGFSGRWLAEYRYFNANAYRLLVASCMHALFHWPFVHRGPYPPADRRSARLRANVDLRRCLAIRAWTPCHMPGLRKDPTMRSFIVIALAASLLTACASPGFDAGRSETVLPLNRAWVDGRIVEYVTTDISDLAMARMVGVNHVPGLSAAARMPPGSSLVARVYKFSNEEQISVFQSAPVPAGAENQDQSYSPLWRVVMVRWLDQAVRRELKSEEQLLAAEERKELVLELTDIVVNCPVTRGAAGEALKGVR